MKKKNIFIINCIVVLLIACSNDNKQFEQNPTNLDTLVKPIIEKTKQTRWDPVIQQSKFNYYVGIEIDSGQVKRFPVSKNAWLSGKAIIIIKDGNIIKEIRVVDNP